MCLEADDPKGAQLAARIKARSRELGFDLVGIAPAEPSRHREYLRKWLEDGCAGDMRYLVRTFASRSDPRAYMPGVASVVCVAVNYHVPLAPVPEAWRPCFGRIARYALAQDYHDLIRSRLFELADWLRQQIPSCRTRVAVDTAPVMEKELAARAGIGWVGKNTCLINQRLGSWMLLGEILTTVPLPADSPAPDRCGSCSRCIDACPTGALTAPYRLDARRCISYLTIEHRLPFSETQRRMINDWLFGCDLCQEVCPWNRRTPSASDPALQPRFPAGGLDVRQVLAWSQEDYRKLLRRSAIRRLKLPLMWRNATAVLENLRAAES